MSDPLPSLTDAVGLASRWAAVLDPLSGSTTPGEDLTELAGRLALLAGSALRDRDRAARIGEQIGRQLAEANLTSPNVVHAVVTALGDHWFCEGPGPATHDIDPACVTTLQGCLAAGHAATVQKLLLTQQEAIHRATVAARNAVERRLRQRATHDPLTGLATRARILQHLDTVLANPRPHHHVAIGLLDLDRFSAVNATWGHRAGDQVLQAVGRRLSTALAGTPAVPGRYDGDEFAVLLSGRRPLNTDDLGTRLRACLAEPVRLDGGPPVRVRAGVAVVELAATRTSTDAVLQAADRALRAAKLAAR